MSLPTRGRPRKSTGSTQLKVCCYGNCSSRSYKYKDKPAEEDVVFIRFPTPCLEYRSSLPGSVFRKQHKTLRKCDKCELATRWVRKCRRASGFVSIDDIRTFTYICSKHFSSVEDARLYKEDPRPMLSSPKGRKRRPPPKARDVTSVKKARKDSDADEQSEILVEKSETENIIESDKDKTSEELQKISNDKSTLLSSNCDESEKNKINGTCDQMAGDMITSGSIVYVEFRKVTLSEKLQQLTSKMVGEPTVAEPRKGRLSDKLKQLQQITNNKVTSDLNVVATKNVYEVNWRSLALKFLESNWTVQLEENGITLLKHYQQFIAMEISITKFKIVVSVRGRILKLPNHIRITNSSENEILRAVSILESSIICQGTNPQEMANIERDLKCCWSPKCVGLMFDKGSSSSVCSACQHESENPKTTQDGVHKKVNYRYMGKRELMNVIKEKKKMLSQQRIKVMNLQRKVAQMLKREQKAGEDKKQELNTVILGYSDNMDLTAQIESLPHSIPIVLCSDIITENLTT